MKQERRRSLHPISLLAGLSLLVSACAPAASPVSTTTPAPASAEAPSSGAESAAAQTVPVISPTPQEPQIIPDVPKDAIPPLDNPKYETVAEATWMRDDNAVVGFEHNGDARAYPLNIMNWHEIVNDTIGGREVTVTYCPLCRSGIVFDRRLNGQLLSFGNTGALYESAMVMYDRETESSWWQVGGLALEGPLKGKRLTYLPAMTTTWREWRTLHPETVVLSRDTPYNRGGYMSDIFGDYGYNDVGSDLWFPVVQRDDRWLAKEVVLGVVLDGEALALSVDRLGDAVVQEVVGGRRVVAFTDEESRSGAVFVAEAEDGRPLTFYLDEEGAYRDRETGSTWDLAGRATAGPLTGSQLQRLAYSSTFWFAWYSAYPGTRLVPGT